MGKPAHATQHWQPKTSGGFASLINISKWPRMASSISNLAAVAMLWLQPWHWAWRQLLGCWSCPSTLVLKQKARTAGPTSMEGRRKRLHCLQAHLCRALAHSWNIKKKTLLTFFLLDNYYMNLGAMTKLHT